jgi:hypothetical protein
MKTQAEEWIRFKQIESPSPKTYRWAVINIRTGETVGVVRWWGAWWKYCYFPIDGTLYDADCLRMISDFVDTQMRHRRSHSSE